MKLQAIGHTMDYEAEQIVLLFFPHPTDIEIQSILEVRDGVSSVETRVRLGDKTNVHIESATRLPTERDLGNLIKRSAFYALRPFSDMPTPWGILTGVRPTKLVQILLSEGHSMPEVRRLLETEYLVEPDKIDLALDVASEEARHIRNPKDVCIYIGIPFCPTRCAYCSFISGTGAVAEKAEYVRLLCEEIRRTGEIIKDLSLTVRAVYIGGGTPTSLDAPMLDTLCHAIRNSFSLSPGTEFTTEAGRPDTITPEKLAVLKAYGTNRLSINPQTLHDETLSRIGRRHTSTQFLEAFSLARQMGFSNINTDLIAGLPGEDFSMFRHSFDTIVSLLPESLTVHTLYLKRASALRQSGAPIVSDASAAADMLAYAFQNAAKNGYRPYYMYRQKATVGNLENVGYSMPGTESFYNTVTMTDCANIFALGAGGVSRLLLPEKVERVFNFKHDDAYCKNFSEILRRKDAFYKLQS